jgi:hypothetical protein
MNRQNWDKTKVSEDDVIYWQDILDAVVAKRTTGLKCPFCYEVSIKVTQFERKSLIKCENKDCRHYIEVGLSADMHEVVRDDLATRK